MSERARFHFPASVAGRYNRLVDPERLATALQAIDDRNASDPHTILYAGQRLPKELTHARMVTAWIQRLRPEAGEALLLAARAHHLRRWTIPRSSYPEGRDGYLAWRLALRRLHARELRTILERLNFDEGTIQRAEAIVLKRDLGRDPDVQALEDAICLTFLETQFHDITLRIDRPKMLEILRKTLRKMTESGRRLATTLELSRPDRALLEEAMGAGR